MKCGLAKKYGLNDDEMMNIPKFCVSLEKLVLYEENGIFSKKCLDYLQSMIEFKTAL